MRTRLTRLLELVGVNSLPVVGVVAGDWTSATALTLYWAENLIASALIALRLGLHRRWAAPPPTATGFTPRATAPSAFLVTAVPFTLAHGVMLAAIFAIAMKALPDLETLRGAVVVLAAMQVVAFGIDLWTLDRWPAARVTAQADHLMGRVVVVHLSIIAGMFLFAWLETEWAFFAVFTGMKVMTDAASFLPRPEPGRDTVPPAWIAGLMRRIPRTTGESFDEYWARTARGEPPPPRGRRARR